MLFAKFIFPFNWLTWSGAVLGYLFAGPVASVDPDAEETEHGPNYGSNDDDQHGQEPRLVDECWASHLAQRITW